eukprot:15480268-Alexandrium_andersonii.AAC.1
MRPRLWLSAVPSSVVDSSGLGRDAFGALMRGTMDALAGSRLAPFDAYLLPDSSPALLRRATDSVVTSALAEGNDQAA